MRDAASHKPPIQLVRSTEIRMMAGVKTRNHGFDRQICRGSISCLPLHV